MGPAIFHSAKFKYDAPKSADTITVKDNGRRLTIRPLELTVTYWSHNAPGYLAGQRHIVVEGRQIRADGTPGQVYRGIVYGDRDDKHDLETAPGWVKEAVASSAAKAEGAL